MDNTIYCKTEEGYQKIDQLKEGIWAVFPIEAGTELAHIDKIADMPLSLKKADLERHKDNVVYVVLNKVDRFVKEGREPPSVTMLVNMIFEALAKELKNG